MKNLKDIWYKITLPYCNEKELISILWNEIEKSYTSPDRYYHNLTHIKYMINKALENKNSLTDINTLHLSIFYHDLVYDIKRQDNEERSSEAAKECLNKLGVPNELIIKCQTQILATKEHKNTKDCDTNYLLDIDLLILSETPLNYMEYSKNIRKEYSVYPHFLYRKGRKKVLRHFISMDRIYKTEEFYQKYEQKAKQNILNELKTL